MILVAAVLLQSGEDAKLHTFVFVSEKPAQSVTVAGSFNNWDKSASKLKVASDGRTWSTSLKLAYGRHYYKFVRDNDEWIIDPKAEKNEDDGNGNINSTLFVVPKDFNRVASPSDGFTALSGLKHTQTTQHLNYDSGKLQLTLRTRKNDVSSVLVNVPTRQVTARLVSSDDLYSHYRADIDWDRKSDFTYSFTAVDGKNKSKVGDFKLTAKSYKPFVVPKWVQGSVIYQIFPDRFANGSKENDPTDLTAWSGEPTYSNRYGGDIEGIRQGTDYLSQLGITTIYFNPIFKSPSNHRYEADDFMLVDPELGTNEEFFKLSRSLKQKGIRTVLDFAFNHTSPRFAQFEDMVKNGARSAFASWYYPKSFPIKVGENPNYEAWFGFPSMPKLNTTNPATTEHLLNVCKYWIQKSDIDGMRLDVANEVDMNFWRKMRPFVKGMKQDLWIVGEIWGDGNPWLKGDQFDSVMNYQFRDAVLKYVAKGTSKTSDFANRLVSVHNSYPSQVSRNMMNLLGSHDTPRFLTECGGDRDLAKLAATIQFTWVGTPSVYYGDELGMEGGKDPENRRGMQWDRANASNEMLAHYRKLINLKRSVSALSTADVRFEQIDDVRQTGVYSRVGEKDAAFIAFNRSNSEQKISIKVPTNVQAHNKKGYIDVISGARYATSAGPINLILKPKSAAVLVDATISNLSPAPLASNHASANGDSAQSRANLIQEPH